MSRGLAASIQITVVVDPPVVTTRRQSFTGSVRLVRAMTRGDLPAY
jgi:hypothetical protein